MVPQELLRALSRLDAERPPVQVGDAARRAVRQVQRDGRTFGEECFSTDTEKAAWYSDDA
jgi:hypothetical protein